MQINLSKSQFLFILVMMQTLLLGGSGEAAELAALDVMQQVDQRDDGDSYSADYTMVLIDRRDRQRVRNMKIYSKDYGQDSKQLSLFETPADIRGTAYLSFDWDDPQRDDDSWLYLPSIQRVKRIASSDTSDSFMGSDFTYADINGIEIDWYDFSFVNKSEIVDGQDCWVIEATAKPQFKERAEQATGYSRLQTWIRKDNYVQVRAQAWELRGNRIKYFTSDQIEQVQGIWTIGRLQAITTRNGRQEHASILQLNTVSFNLDIDDDLFATESMQRGLN
jgi:hypothetical protein